MPNNPGLRFDLNLLYNLAEVFDQTGRLMHHADWQGTEAFARRKDDPQKAQAERDQILDDIKAIKASRDPYELMMREETGSEAHELANAELVRLNAQLSGLAKRLQSMPLVLDWWIDDRAAYERRRSVETELRQAFSNGELNLIVGLNRVADWLAWSQRPEFRVYFGLSMVRMPSGESNQRRGPAYVERTVFDEWAKKFPATGDALGPSAVANWLREMGRQHPERRPKLKAEMLNDARAIFPSLSERAFDRLWAIHAPDKWKRPGPTP